MSDLGIRPGDRVKVHTEYEGTVDWMDPHRYAVKDDDGNLRRVARTYRGTKVTRVEPPVEQFRPGDVVRDKRTDFEYVLTENGYVEKIHGKWYRRSRRRAPFDSRSYEKVV